MAKVSKDELGMGIRALLGNQEKKQSKVSSGISTIPIDQIEANPYQPRSEFDESALEELADSIKAMGIIQPLTVRKLSGNSYQLIAGERRLRASKLAGLTEVPAFVRTADDQQMLEMALVENIQRHDLNAIEVAVSYHRLMEECSLTHEEMSQRVGKKRSTISNYVRLLKLPPVVQSALINEQISMGHARAILGLQTEILQLETLKRVLADDLSVRDTEAWIKKMQAHMPGPTAQQEATDPLTRQVEDHLSQLLESKVKLKRSSKGKGTITIAFGSDDDLNRILDRIESN